MIRIEQITAEKEDYLDILLIADPSEKAILKYLGEGDLFVMFDEGEPVCAASVLRISQDTCELKNIAAKTQGKGYGRKMLEYVFGFYKNKFLYMEVGTGNSSTGNIRFYEKNGFKITHTIDNFFIDNYTEPIFEDGVQCKHMVMMKKSLQEEEG